MSQLKPTVFGEMENDKRFKNLQKTLSEIQTKNGGTWSNISSITRANLGGPGFYPLISTPGDEIISSSANMIIKNLSKDHNRIVTSSEINSNDDKKLMPPPKNTETLAHSSRRNSLSSAFAGKNPRESLSTINEKPPLSIASTIIRSPSMRDISQLQFEANPISEVNANNNKPDRVFYNWRVMLNEAGHLLIKGVLPNGKAVKSKPVIQRLSETNVLSRYHNIYNLQGNICDEKHELPEYIRGKFYNGFPDDWENVYQVWYTYVNGGSKLDFRWPQEVSDTEDEASSIFSEDIKVSPIKVRNQVQPHKNVKKLMNCSVMLNKLPPNTNKTMQNEKEELSKSAYFDKIDAVNNSKTTTVYAHSDSKPTSIVSTLKPFENSSHVLKLNNSVISLNESKSTLADIFTQDLLNLIFNKISTESNTAENIDKVMTVLGHLKHAMVRKAEMDSEIHDIKMKVLSMLFSDDFDDNKKEIDQFPQVAINGNTNDDNAESENNGEQPSKKLPMYQNKLKAREKYEDLDQTQKYVYKVQKTICNMKGPEFIQTSKQNNLGSDGDEQPPKNSTVFPNKLRPCETNKNTNQIQNCMDDIRKRISNLEDAESVDQTLKQSNLQNNPYKKTRKRLSERITRSNNAEDTYISLSESENKITDFNRKKYSSPTKAQLIFDQHYQPEVIRNQRKETDFRENKENIVMRNKESKTENKTPEVTCKFIKFPTQNANKNTSKPKSVPQIIKIETVSMDYQSTKKSEENVRDNINKQKTEVPQRDKHVKDSFINGKNTVSNEVPSTSKNLRSLLNESPDKKANEMLSSSKEKELKDSKNEKSKSQTSDINISKKLIKWTPSVIKKPVAGYGLVFEGKLLNDAGHVYNAKFVTDFVIERISPKLIRTENNDCIELKGELSDPKHSIPKPLQKLCLNGCPMKIQTFCQNWVDLMINKTPSSIKDITADDVTMNLSSRGRKRFPVMDYWNGERVLSKDNKTIYNLGNVELPARPSSLELSKNTSYSMKKNRSLSPNKSHRNPSDSLKTSGKSFESEKNQSVRRRSLRTRNLKRPMKEYSDSSEEEQLPPDAKKSRLRQYSRKSSDNKKYTNRNNEFKNVSNVDVIKLEKNMTAQYFKMPNKNGAAELSDEVTSNA